MKRKHLMNTRFDMGLVAHCINLRWESWNVREVWECKRYHQDARERPWQVQENWIGREDDEELKDLLKRWRWAGKDILRMLNDWLDIGSKGDRFPPDQRTVCLWFVDYSICGSKSGLVGSKWKWLLICARNAGSRWKQEEIHPISYRIRPGSSWQNGDQLYHDLIYMSAARRWKLWFFWELSLCSEMVKARRSGLGGF